MVVSADGVVGHSTRAALSIGGVERGNFNAEAGKSESTGPSVVRESGIL